MTESKPFYDYMYTKHDGLGFKKEQDIEILKKLYPDARKITIIYSVPGEAYFVLER